MNLPSNKIQESDIFLTLRQSGCVCECWRGKGRHCCSSLWKIFWNFASVNSGSVVEARPSVGGFQLDKNTNNRRHRWRLNKKANAHRETFSSYRLFLFLGFLSWICARNRKVVSGGSLCVYLLFFLFFFSRRKRSLVDKNTRIPVSSWHICFGGESPDPIYTGSLFPFFQGYKNLFASACASPSGAGVSEVLICAIKHL